MPVRKLRRNTGCTCGSFLYYTETMKQSKPTTDISMKKLILLPVFAAVMVLFVFARPGFAQSDDTAAPLDEKQRILGERYEQLEGILLRMAEINAQTNPRRTTLIKKVLASSKDKLLEVRFEELASVLGKKRYSEAIEGQTELEADLLELLALLESENRDKEREEERKRIEEYIKEINRLIHEQKDVLNKTERAIDPKSIAPDERKISDQTDKLSDRMAESKEVGAPNKESRPDQNKPKEGESKEGESQEGQSQEGQSQESQSKPQPKKANENQSPTQRAMQQALEHMKQAEERLKKAEKQGAMHEQEEAVAELQRAKAELERILRQLREEEIMQRLQMLEARVRKMLQLENAIRRLTDKYNTQKIEAGSDEAALRQVQVFATRLSNDQEKVSQEAEIAILLLREDGTAMAMEEALVQTRFDMDEVTERLREVELGEQTMAVEDMIIEALEEMLEAIEQAKKDSEKRMEELKGGGGSGQPGKQPIVELLAELRMIRSMQKRVYERTKYYETLIQGNNPDLEMLETRTEELTRQQTKIKRILHELNVGRHE